MTSSISIPPNTNHISLSSDSSPLFSIQDALLTYSGLNGADPDLYVPNPGSGTLFRSGCVVDGILNCTAACQDVNQIFADPHTFQNCMVMASLNGLYQNATLDGSSTALAEDFSIHVDQPSFQSLANLVNQTIQDCLYQYLSEYSSLYPDGIDNWSPWYYIKAPFVSESAYLGFPSVCDNLLAPLNADVGGIGV